MRNSDFQFGQQRTMLLIVGWFVVVLIGVGMLLVGFMLGAGQSSEKAQVSPTATLALPGVQPTAIALIPTYTPLPTDTLLPTSIPAPTPVPEPMIVAQAGGVNLRSGPGINFAAIGRLEEGQSARVTGRYGDWWQVDYVGAPAWVANWVVTASNTEGVAEVVPPPSPIPSTAVPPTAIPPTAAPTAIPATAAPDTRGLTVKSFIVGNKVKDKEEVKSNTSFGNAGDIWFCFDVVNSTGGGITLSQVGGWAQENDHFQVSWGTGGSFTVPAGGTVGGRKWCDHFYNDRAPKFKAGTYHIWLRICFQDGYCVNAAGPVEVKIG
jgi:uncharacterized protein YgiM (DUF1202 family)